MGGTGLEPVTPSLSTVPPCRSNRGVATRDASAPSPAADRRGPCSHTHLRTGVEPFDLVLRKLGVVGDERQVFELSLCDEHPVKGILVVPRKLACRDRVSDFDRQFDEVVLLDRARDVE